MAKTGHPNFDYTLQGYWRGQVHEFSIAANHTGSALTGTDVESFMTGATSPMAVSYAPLLSPAIVVTKARYYNGVDSAPTFEAVYTGESPAPTPIQPTGLAWGTDPLEEYYPLEVCVLLEAQIGLSSTNKPVYVRKYLRGCSASAKSVDSNNETVVQVTTAATACAKAQGDGSWYSSKAYCSPKGGQPLAASWVVRGQYYNFQVPRGRKKTTGKSVSLTAAEIAALSAAGFGYLVAG